MLKYVTLIIIAFALVVSGVQAKEKETTNLNVVKDDVLGCEAKFDNEGVIKSMKCVGESEMTFSDAKGVRIAKQKASMRAMANMSQFMSRKIRTKEVMDDMTKTLTEKTGQKDEAVRKSVETHVEQITHESDALLKGVQVIYTDVDKDAKTVIVHVGVNRQTMKAADQLRGQMSRNLENEGARKASTASQEGTGRVIKKSKQYDDF
jgi:hypothetical protein